MSSSTQRDHNAGPIDIHTARQKGLINTATGEVKLPQYGTSILIDDALMQGRNSCIIHTYSQSVFMLRLQEKHVHEECLLILGLVVTSVPLSTILSKPAAPYSISVFQAFQQGLINPFNLTVRNNLGQFISFEEALASGFLYPRASSSYGREGSVSREIPIQREHQSNMNTMRSTSVPPGSTMPKNYSYSYKKMMSHESSGGGPSSTYRAGGSVSRAPQHHMVNGGAHMKPGVGTLPHGNSSLHEQRWRHQSSNSNQGFYPEQTHSPLLNGNAHFVNGRLYASKPGFKVEGNGMVINLSTGETFDLTTAQRMNIIQQIPDDEYDHGGGMRGPPNNLFNRVSGSKAKKARTGFKSNYSSWRLKAR